MKKTLTVLSLSLFLVIAPVHAYAKWWNPLTWSQKTTAVPVLQDAPVSQPILPATSPLPAPSPRTIVKTVTVTDTAQVEALQAQVRKLTDDNARLTAENADLHNQVSILVRNGAGSQSSSPAPLPRSKDQLIAQYRVNNPMETCKPIPGEDDRVASNRCALAIRAYQEAMSRWVDQQLASQ